MKFKIKIIITIMVSLVVIVSMSLFIVNSNSISISGFNSDTVITGSNNSYLITLKGVPSGNGMYQQLITINNYSKYGINDNGSNIEFFDYSNYTHLYAWIQSINLTLMQVWIKNYNDSSIINMRVLSSFENLFSVNGYLGVNAQFGDSRSLDNMKMVFPVAYYFSGNGNLNTSSIWNNNGYGADSGIYNNGLTLTDQSYQTKAIYNSIDSGVIFEIAYTQNNTSDENNRVGFTDNFILNKYQLQLYNGSASVFSNGVYNSYIGFNYYRISNPTNGTFKWYENNTLLSTLSITNEINMNNLLLQALYAGFQFKVNYIAYYNSGGSMPSFTIGGSLYHSVDFKLLGLITSFQWSILINGIKYNASSSNIYLNMTNGNYGIIVNLPAGYSAITKGVLYVNGTNQVYKIFVSYNNNSGISNDIIYAIILASIIVAAAIYFSKRS